MGEYNVETYANKDRLNKILSFILLGVQLLTFLIFILDIQMKIQLGAMNNILSYDENFIMLFAIAIQTAASCINFLFGFDSQKKPIIWMGLIWTIFATFMFVFALYPKLNYAVQIGMNIQTYFNPYFAIYIVLLVIIVNISMLLYFRRDKGTIKVKTLTRGNEAVSAKVMSNIASSLANQKIDLPDGISIKRQFEYFSGFIRIKVKSLDNGKYIMSRTRLKLDVPESLIIRKIEPAYPREENEVEIGSIPPSSEKTVSYILEPMICGKEKVYGVLECLDHKGAPKIVPMSPLEVEVICPLLFTEEEVNIAKLNNLITHKLHNQDERCYGIPEGLTPNRALGIIKNIIQRHHVKFVSETIDDNPFEAKLWYYGKSKVHQREFVVQGIISQKSNLMKIIVSCEEEVELIGLLSELGNDMRKELLRSGIIDSEDLLRALRCPDCAGPLDKCPLPNESITCPYCGASVSI